MSALRRIVIFVIASKSKASRRFAEAIQGNSLISDLSLRAFAESEAIYDFEIPCAKFAVIARRLVAEAIQGNLNLKFNLNLALNDFLNFKRNLKFSVRGKGA